MDDPTESQAARVVDVDLDAEEKRSDSAGSCAYDRTCDVLVGSTDVHLDPATQRAEAVDEIDEKSAEINEVLGNEKESLEKRDRDSADRTDSSAEESSSEVDASEKVDASVYEEASNRPAKRIKRAQSAWMFFVAEKRREILEGQANLRIGDAMKIIAEKWSSMDMNERAVYDERAAEDKLRYQMESDTVKLSAHRSASDCDGANGESDPATETILPLARVKKTIKMDEEVKNVTPEAVALVAKATELFLSSFAKGTWGITSQMRRKNIRVSDIQECASNNGPFMFLKDEFDYIEKPRKRGNEKVDVDNSKKVEGTISKYFIPSR